MVACRQHKAVEHKNTKTLTFEFVDMQIIIIIYIYIYIYENHSGVCRYKDTTVYRHVEKSIDIDLDI